MKSLPTESRYPKIIYVGAEVYTVSFVRKLKDYGVTDAGARTIKIRAGMSRRETFSTFIHELLHALEFDYSIKIKHKSVYKLEQAIFQLLVDNFL